MVKTTTSGRSRRQVRKRTLWAVITHCNFEDGSSAAEGIVRTAAAANPEMVSSWLSVSAGHSNSRRARYYHKALFSIRSFAELLTTINKGDTILAVTKPCTAPVWVSIAALIRGASYAYVWGAEPEVARDGLGYVRISAVLRIQDLIQRWSLKHVERIVVTSRELANIAAKKTDGLDIRVDLIPSQPGQVEFFVK